MKVYIKGVRSRVQRCNAQAIFNEHGEELYRVNYWDNPRASESMERSIADWLKSHPQYELDEDLCLKYN